MIKKDGGLAFKIILIGDCRVGKTSFLKRITAEQSSFIKQTPPTLGVEYVTKNIKVPQLNRQIKAQIWDTSGAEKYQSITSSYYRKSQGALLFFDVTQRQSFDNIVKWLNTIKKMNERKIAIVLVANKIDLVQSGQKQRKVFESQITQFCIQHHLTFKQTSSLTGQNVVEVFQQLVEKIYEIITHNQSEYHEFSDMFKVSFTSDHTLLNKKKSDTVTLKAIPQQSHINCKCCN